ncbi:MAG: hypothetical protein DLM57_08150 [Pseudonocardiales bacterium]|nr:MAG: hypothetical protein DLM57_08150 [Pseudonocardiales bacterium]
MSVRLLLDEHYSETVASQLRAAGYDVVAVVADAELRAQPDEESFRRAAAASRRIVTENVKDFRPQLQRAYANGDPVAQLLLVPATRFPRGSGRRSAAIRAALLSWLSQTAVTDRPDEDWLV